jgi:hypothetical protein
MTVRLSVHEVTRINIRRVNWHRASRDYQSADLTLFDATGKQLAVVTLYGPDGDGAPVPIAIDDANPVECDPPRPCDDGAGEDAA